MANFNIAYERTAKFEGEYSNDPVDAGGETYAGISRRAHPKWDGWKIVDEMKKKSGFPKNLRNNTTLKNLVRNLYKANYWDTIWGDRIVRQEVANEIYDFGVNAGVARSVKLQQRQFGMKETGKMDEKLLAKLNSVK